jgi:hypothetical protein
MGIYSKYKNVNTVFGGTGGLVLPQGSTAERDSGTVVGTLRYNTDLGLVEQYNALGWQSVDAPPTVSSFTGVVNENTNTTLTITGSNFKSGAQAYITGAAVSGIDRALSTTWVSASTVTIATNAASVNYIGGAAYGLKVTNPSGLSGTLDPGGNIDRDPLWVTASTTSSPTQIFDSGRSTTITYSATDADSNAITYSLVTGSLPAGASLNVNTGVVSGFSAVGSDTTSTFTLRASSTNGTLTSTQDRGFAITVRAPVVTSYTSVGSTTFTAPFTGNIQVMVVAGGGAGGGGTAGGGGAGGMVVAPSFPITSGTPYTVTVGGGGPMPTGQNTGVGSNGGNSVFGGITAVGGGGGSGFPPGASGQPGGSGGGAGQYPGWGGPFGHGTGTQGPSGGGTGYGSNGGQYSGGNPGSHGGGGGGGAGGGGQAGPQGNGGVGLAFPAFSPTVRGGGGQGGSEVDRSQANSAGGGGRGGPGGQQNSGSSPYPGSARGGESGLANTGGGGGGGWDYGSGGAGQGGSGIVIIRY